MHIFSKTMVRKVSTLIPVICAAMVLGLRAGPVAAHNCGSSSVTIDPQNTTVANGGQVSFSATVSGFKGPRTYAWTFEQGSPLVSSSSSETVTYDTDGTWNVSLHVTGGKAGDCTDDTTVTVGAVNAAPVCTIDTPTNDPVNILTGQSVNYSGTATDSDGTVVSWLWTFGDPAIPDATVEDPGPVTYNTAGSYQTTFMATDDGMATCAQQTRTINVTDPGEPPPPITQRDFKILMNYELGMHCTGFEFAYCCVLPVYNSILAQVVLDEDSPLNATGSPEILEGDPVNGRHWDLLGRETVLRHQALDGNGEFKKYVLAYEHHAQPRNDGRGKQPQLSTLISQVEGNTLMAWNTRADAASVINQQDLGHGPMGPLDTSGSYNGAYGVVQGDGVYDTTGGTFGMPIDNFQNAIFNHFYIYDISADGVEGAKVCAGDATQTCFTDGDCANTPAPNTCGNPLEKNKYRLGLHVDYPANVGPAGHPMGPSVAGGVEPGIAGMAPGNLLTFSGDNGTVVYTQMKVLEDLPIMLTSPGIWEALGLPLTPFEDSIGFFADPGLVGEESIRPFAKMQASLYEANCDTDPLSPNYSHCTLGAAVMDSAGEPVVGFGTAPIDIPNCERCHSVIGGQNSPNMAGTRAASLVTLEKNFWMAYYDINPALGDEDWYARLKAAAISILAKHDNDNGTHFTDNFPAVGDHPLGSLGNTLPMGSGRCSSDVAEACNADSDCTVASDVCSIPSVCAVDGTTACFSDADCTSVGGGVCGGNNLDATTELGGLFNVKDIFPEMVPASSAYCLVNKTVPTTGAIACDEHSDCDPATTDGICDLPQNTRLGHESVICHKCHADNVIAVVKSAFKDVSKTQTIPSLSDALHWKHRNASEGGQIVFNDLLGRDGGCQGCHPAHRSDGDMSNYPITESGDNFYVGLDNRDANGGCFVGRDVHSNPLKDAEATTESHLNPVGQWLLDNVANDSSSWKGIWCTNCHTQASQEIWKAENVADLVHDQPGCVDSSSNVVDCTTLSSVEAAVEGLSVRMPVPGAPNSGILGDVVDTVNLALGTSYSTTDFENWLDPKVDPMDPLSLDPNDVTHTIWDTSSTMDASVAIVEVAGSGCVAPYTTYLDPTFGVDVCAKLDADGDPTYRILEGFCTTPDCVASAQATLDGEPNGGTAVAVPFYAATDAHDHWLAPGEPHCADCHHAPYVEQSGNVKFRPPFNYPRKASLMRYSKGHRGITCQGCHESIHGLYPVTPPGSVSQGTVAIDQTSWDQAGALNPDGSHGPLKCGTCHETGADGIPNWVRKLQYTYDGVTTNVSGSFDTAVSWMHTYTEETSPLESVCLNCHGVKQAGNEPWDEISSTNKKWVEHTYRGRVSRATMTAAELNSPQGHVSGDPDVEDPFTTLCVSCHVSRSNSVSCSNDKWKNHLITGRADEKVWEFVSTTVTGSTCGW